MNGLISDEKFDINNTIQYRLSIQVTPDGFSFLVSPEDRQVIAFKKSPLKITASNLLVRHLNDWIQENELLRHNFKDVRIFVFEELFSITPDIFSNQITETIWGPGKNENSTVITNTVDSLNATLEFQVNKDVKNIILQTWSNAQFVHPVSQIIEKATTCDHVMLYTAFLVQSKNVYFLVIYRNEKLILAHGFTALHENDMLYQIINVFQQLGIARSQTKLITAGAIQSVQDTENFLAAYFPVWGKLNSDFDDDNLLHHFLHF